MNKVFFLGGEYVRPEVAHNLMQLIAEGTGLKLHITQLAIAII